MHQKADGVREKIRQESLKNMHQVRSMTRQQLENRNLELLNVQLQYAQTHSPFYQKYYQGRNLPAVLSQIDNLRDFPFTVKEHLRENYPFDFLATGKNNLIRYGESTGSTGKPTSAFMTYKDWERGNVWLENSLMNTFGPEDMVFIAIPYELAFASYDIDRAFENIGVTIVAVGALNMVCPWERTIQMMRHVKPTVLVSSPSRILHLYDSFLSQGFDPHEVGLKTLLYVGETCSDAKLEKIASLWGIELITAYGSTETNSLALVCEEGKQHLTEDRHYFEIIDPATEQAVDTGQRGELIVTTLTAEAMPLIRYRTGDVVSVDDSNCACGQPQRRIKHYGRLNESISYQGKSYLRYDIEQAILSVDGTGCYYILAPETHEFKVYVNIEGRNPKKVLREVCDNVIATLGFDPVVEEIQKDRVHRAMGRILKPGSVTYDDLLRAEKEM